MIFLFIGKDFLGELNEEIMRLDDRLCHGHHKLQKNGSLVKGLEIQADNLGLAWGYFGRMVFGLGKFNFNN